LPPSPPSPTRGPSPGHNPYVHPSAWRLPGRQWTSGHCFPSLPSFHLFQALFNSLFNVLCVFPSRYLFAIGLPHLFRFRWGLPPPLSCDPKQLN
ncbi:unnamed protein product, partial [Choristocarpus tenellus]